MTRFGGAGNEPPEDPIDFESATAVIKLDDETWEGVRPLRLPILGARGVYGGHTCSQTLLVAIDSAPGYVPHSFHSHFIKAGDPKTKSLYKVRRFNDGETFCQRHILVYQNNKISYTAMCSLVKKGAMKSAIAKGELSGEDYVHKKPDLTSKYKDPSKLHKTYHTDFIVNAYSDEFLNYELCPQERDLLPSERWISLWSKFHQPQKHKMDEPKFNYVALAHLSDAAVLTTLARALHLDWNPSVDNPYEEFDEDKDARFLTNITLNALHIHHYTAMSLDHHIYFHSDDFESFNVVEDWLALTYQFQISKNNRTLVRGHFFDKNEKCVATFYQEGLTYMKPGVPGVSGKKFSKF